MIQHVAHRTKILYRALNYKPKGWRAHMLALRSMLSVRGGCGLLSLLTSLSLGLAAASIKPYRTHSAGYMCVYISLAHTHTVLEHSYPLL